MNRYKRHTPQRYCAPWVDIDAEWDYNESLYPFIIFPSRTTNLDRSILNAVYRSIHGTHPTTPGRGSSMWDRTLNK